MCEFSWWERVLMLVVIVFTFYCGFAVGNAGRRIENREKEMNSEEE